MKINKSLPYLCLCLLSTQLYTSCKEDDTLDGAKEVYITIEPKEINLTVGDTLQMIASVTNLAGKTIDTPVSWMVDDSKLVEVVDDKLVALNGAQGKTTKVRAVLENGKYAVREVVINNHVLSGIKALEKVHYTYSKKQDSIWFEVTPKGLLFDYEPKVENSNPEAFVPVENPIYVDKETGRVAYVFDSSNKTTKGSISLYFESDDSKKATTEVVVSPTIVSTLGDDFNLITYEASSTMDINSVDTVWVNTKVVPTYDIDLNNATQLYNWTAEGNAAQMIETGALVVENVGHRAYAVIRSGNLKGQSRFVFECNGTTLASTVDIQDYRIDYPVDELTVSANHLNMEVGKIVSVTPHIKPLSSYGIHQPKFTPEDPTIVEVLGYNDSEVLIKGLKAGKTTILVTSNDKSVTITVDVKATVSSVVLAPENVKNIFVGQSVTWAATVYPDNVIVPEWISQDPTIAVIDAMGKITGKQKGKVKIQAQAGGVLSTPAELNVVGIPTGDLSYDASNTDLDGCATYMDNGKINIYLSPRNTNPYAAVILTIDSGATGWTVESGTYDAATYPMVFEADGASVAVKEGTVTIASHDNNGLARLDIDLLINLGEQNFRLKATNLPTY